MKSPDELYSDFVDSRMEAHHLLTILSNHSTDDQPDMLAIIGIAAMSRNRLDEMADAMDNYRRMMQPGLKGATE